MSDLYALLWSKSQNCFHVEEIERTARSGQRFLNENATNDYLLVSFGTREQVEHKADEMRPVLLEREEVRRLYEANE